MIALADDPVGLQLLRIAAWRPDHVGLEALDAGQWNALVERFAEARLAPLAAHLFSKSGFTPPVPAMETLARHCREFAILSLSQQHELAKLAGIFAAEGIGFVALKGIAVAHRHYPHAALRPMRDLDLLMQREDAARGQEILLDRGYAMPADVIAKPIDQSHQHPVLRSPTSGVLVELHHGLVSDGWSEGARFADEMLASRQSIQCLGRSIAVPDETQLLVHLLAHATRNRPFDVGPQFLADFRSFADRPAPVQVLREFGVERAWHLAQAMLARVAGEEPADEIADRADAALALLLLDDEDERERKLLMRSGGDRVSPGWAVGKLLRPTPDALAQLSGRAAADRRRWLAYPRWLALRTRRLFAARNSARLRADVTASMSLREWLTNGEHSRR